MDTGELLLIGIVAYVVLSQPPKKSGYQYTGTGTRVTSSNGSDNSAKYVDAGLNVLGQVANGIIGYYTNGGGSGSPDPQGIDNGNQADYTNYDVDYSSDYFGPGE